MTGYWEKVQTDGRTDERTWVNLLDQPPKSVGPKNENMLLIDSTSFFFTDHPQLTTPVDSEHNILSCFWTLHRMEIVILVD